MMLGYFSFFTHMYSCITLQPCPNFKKNRRSHPLPSTHHHTYTPMHTIYSTVDNETLKDPEYINRMPTMFTLLIRKGLVDVEEGDSHRKEWEGGKCTSAAERKPIFPLYYPCIPSERGAPWRLTMGKSMRLDHPPTRWYEIDITKQRKRHTHTKNECRHGPPNMKICIIYAHTLTDVPCEGIPLLPHRQEQM